MAIEVRIPKEITEYKARYVAGLTMRQIVSTAVAGVIGIPAYFAVNYFLGSDAATNVILVLCMPIFAFGWVQPKGYDLEVYLTILYRHRVTPQKRLYTTDNLLVKYDTEPPSEFEEKLRNVQVGKCTGAQEADLLYQENKKKERLAIKLAKKDIRTAKKAFKLAVKESKKVV